ncbi:Chromosome alignment-maintaining phosphoprotein 1 [Liparis tanakae]|uniref:Chromosome alignment-maintaining phosphoprotein 1 n=1 Tax=Liparis tanakae TaxID=230148 RepID=A0A4Z2EDN2_9TELE|nr:Chromosome alignment-maintaining phosphoprotein 1 [Liparis tanakae]
MSAPPAPGAAAAHLQCPLCGYFSKSHAHQLTHVAAAHPARLDGVAVGRLGNLLMYQSAARLFHCADCFFTSRDFSKVLKHIISRHCEDARGGEEGEEGETVRGEGEETKEEGEEETRGEGEEQRKTRGEGEEQRKTRGEGEEQRKTRAEAEEQRKTRAETMEEGEEKTREEGEEQRKTREEGEEQRKTRAETMEEGEEKTREEGEEQRKMRAEQEAPVAPVLLLGAAGYRHLEALALSQAARKHDVPEAYAATAVRGDAAPPPQAPEDEGAGLSAEQLREEEEATARVVRFAAGRFACLLCGWKTKLKGGWAFPRSSNAPPSFRRVTHDAPPVAGFAISHVVRRHDVPRPYACRRCARRFFLPSRLQRHVAAAHRPGRYACPFCRFRSHAMGGFRRHCSRCNARGGGGWAGGGGEGLREEEEEEAAAAAEEKTGRGERKRKRTERAMEEDEEDDE